MLAFTLVISLVTGVLFGLAPAWGTTRMDLASVLRQGRRMTSGGSRLKNTLLAFQVALSVLLLAGAGLFIRTLFHLEHVDLGFDRERLLVFKVQPSQTGYEGERLVDFYDRLSGRLESIPGVRAATFGRIPLIADYNWNTSLLLPGERRSTAAEHMTNRQIVRENYFETLEIPRLRGRGFTAQDDARAPRVAIVNQTLARKFFPNQDPLGQRLRESDEGTDWEIVGVVGRHQVQHPARRHRASLFTPWRQEVSEIGDMRFALRAAGEPVRSPTPCGAPCASSTPGSRSPKSARRWRSRRRRSRAKGSTPAF